MPKKKIIPRATASRKSALPSSGRPVDAVLRGRENRESPGSQLLAEVTGSVRGHRHGHGFLVTETKEEIFLSPVQMRAVLHGDVVRARIERKDRRGRLEARVLDLIDRPTRTVIGKLLNQGDMWLVAPEDKRFQDVCIPGITKRNAREWKGKIVVAQLEGLPQLSAQPVGKIVEVLGDEDDPGIEIEIAVRKYDLPHVFSAQCAEAAEALADYVVQEDWEGRVDLTQTPLVTIDGEDARDFDDALYCEPIALGRGKKPNGWRMLVAIADVSHYVRADEAIDRDAQERSTSVYFPRKVIPMLPEKLSNDLCSLKPHMRRLCMVCDMRISKTGQVRSYQFYPALMRSHARLTYAEVAENLDGMGAAKTNELETQHIYLMPHLRNLYEAYRALLRRREERGAVDFETVETHIVCDHDGRITDIVPRMRTEAHRLVEEAMLAANACAAQLIAQARQHCLYRVHEGPTSEKLQTLRQYLSTLGLPPDVALPKEGDSPAVYQALAKATKERPDAVQVHTMLLRSMQQASYSPQNKGHFGLAYEAYTHFTSPIRRYPDLLVHRVIKEILALGRAATRTLVVKNVTNRAPKKTAPVLPKLDWHALGVHTSACERRADEASRDVLQWLKCKFMQTHLGERFSGTVSAVAGFGLFVTLDEMFVEGLVHVSELGGEYWHFDGAQQQLRAERTGKCYTMGMRLAVQVSRVDMDARKIDLVMATPKRREHSD